MSELQKIVENFELMVKSMDLLNRRLDTLEQGRAGIGNSRSVDKGGKGGPGLRQQLDTHKQQQKDSRGNRADIAKVNPDRSSNKGFATLAKHIYKHVQIARAQDSWKENIPKSVNKEINAVFNSIKLPMADASVNKELDILLENTKRALQKISSNHLDKKAAEVKSALSCFNPLDKSKAATLAKSYATKQFGKRIQQQKLDASISEAITLVGSTRAVNQPEESASRKTSRTETTPANGNGGRSKSNSPCSNKRAKLDGNAPGAVIDVESWIGKMDTTPAPIEKQNLNGTATLAHTQNSKAEPDAALDLTFTVNTDTNKEVQETQRDNSTAEDPKTDGPSDNPVTGKIKYKIPLRLMPGLEVVKKRSQDLSDEISELSRRKSEKEQESVRTTKALERMKNKKSQEYTNKILVLAKQTTEIATLSKKLQTARQNKKEANEAHSRYLVDNHDPGAIVLESGTPPSETNSA